MRRAALLTAALISLAAVAAGAGTYGLGNGGHGLECSPAPANPVFQRGMTLLDLYEGSAVYRRTYRDLSSLRGLSLETAFNRALRMFFREEPFRMQRSGFAAWFARLGKEALFVDHLPTWSGTFLSPIPRECVIRQGVVQVLPRRLGTESPGKLMIARDVWNEFSTDLKVAILMHEYVYRHLALSNPGCGHSNVRRVTGILLADEDPRRPKYIMLGSALPTGCIF